MMNDDWLKNLVNSQDVWTIYKILNVRSSVGISYIYSAEKTIIIST